MVIVHAYLRLKGNIVTSLPFRYNNGDDMPLSARELILDVEPAETLDNIRQRVITKFDEEKALYGEADDFASGMPGIITIE